MDSFITVDFQTNPFRASQTWISYLVTVCLMSTKLIGLMCGHIGIRLKTLWFNVQFMFGFLYGFPDRGLKVMQLSQTYCYFVHPGSNKCQKSHCFAQRLTSNRVVSSSLPDIETPCAST